VGRCGPDRADACAGLVPAMLTRLAAVTRRARFPEHLRDRWEESMRPAEHEHTACFIVGLRLATLLWGMRGGVAHPWRASLPTGSGLAGKRAGSRN